MRILIKLAAVAAFLLLPSSVLAIGNIVVSIVPATSSANVGDLVSVDVVIDSDGIDLAGYSFSVALEQNGNRVGVVTDASTSTTPLLVGSIENVFGNRNICPGGVGCTDDGFFNLNQSSFSGEAPAGIFTVETLSFRPTANGALELIPFFNTGDSLGIAGGACPPGAGGQACDVTFVSGVVNVGAVPEPAALLMLGGGALALLAARRRS